MRLAHDPGIEFLHRGVKDRAEHRGVDLLGDLVVGLEPRHGVKIEPQGTGHIAEESRRRERGLRFGVGEASETLHDPLVLGHLDRIGLGEVDIHTHLDLPDGKSALVVELVDVAARFARRFVVGVRAVEHPHPPGALHEAVKIVGVNPLVVLGRGQSVGRPQVVGHERRLRHVVAREVVVVHREQDDVFEIEVAGFEDAHDLHPFERLALVGDAHGLQMAAQQRGVNLRRQLDVALVQRIAEFGNLLRNHGQKLHALTPVVALVGRPGHGGDDPQQPVGQLAPPGGGRKDHPQQVVASQPCGVDRNAPFAHDLVLHGAGLAGIAVRDVGVRENAHGVGMVESASCALRAAVGLQLHEAFDEGVGQAGPQRIAHCDVDLPDLGRQGVEQRQEQVFIGQHHGGALVQRPSCGQFPQDRGGVLALHGVRHGGHGGQLLRTLHVVVRHIPARRELHDVLAHEHPGLLLGAVFIIGVVIPVEIGLGSRREEAE